MITKCTKCGDEVERRHLLKKVECFEEDHHIVPCTIHYNLPKGKKTK